MSFYFFCWKSSSKAPCAFSPDDKKAGYELIPEIEGKNSLPFDFRIKKITEKKSGIEISDDLTELKDLWLDYMPNNLAWPLMSLKLQAIIEENLLGTEDIDWISCMVKTDFEIKEYKILRFNKLKDVLDLKKTTFVPGTSSIIKPVIDLSKANNYSVIIASNGDDTPLWKIPPVLYVNETVMKAVKRHGITGVELSKTAAN